MFRPKLKTLVRGYGSELASTTGNSGSSPGKRLHHVSRLLPFRYILKLDIPVFFRKRPSIV